MDMRERSPVRVQNELDHNRIKSERGRDKRASRDRTTSQVGGPKEQRGREGADGTGEERA